MSLKDQIKQEIEQLVDPSTNKTLGEQNSLRHLVVDEEDSIARIFKITAPFVVSVHPHGDGGNNSV